MPKVKPAHTQWVVGACPHDCPDTCSWLVEVDPQQGKALSMRGHPDHPITQGALCTKVSRYLERTYHPERVLYPLLRTGNKGEGRFERISWEKALDILAQKLGEVMERHGSEAILPYSYSGTLGLLQNESMDRRFAHVLGTSRLGRTLCAAAGAAGYKYTIGASVGLAPEDFAHARFILLWGTNPLTSHMHLWPFIQEARKKGAYVVVIDPIRTRTARQADQWLPIRPGTDAALALAMMHVIIRENLWDREYVEAYTLGFTALQERVAQWTPERAAHITGLTPEDIVTLARRYAQEQPAAIRINYGIQRHGGGGMAVRTIAMLPALVGAWKHPGGGILLSTSGAFPINTHALRRPDLLPHPTRKFNATRLGDALSPNPVQRRRALMEGENDGPVHAFIVYNGNPAATAPDQNAVLRGLAREDLFTVVLEHFVTDTARYADLILPATTQVEHWDLHTSYGHYYLALNRPAIPPRGESLPNTEIFRRMAQALGIHHPALQEPDEVLIQQALDVEHPWMPDRAFDRLMERGFLRLNLPQPFLPFAQGGFFTPSGKCEFYSAQAQADGFDPLPDFTPPHEVLRAEADQALAFLSPSAHYFLNSNYANSPRMQRREGGEPRLFLHPEEARARGIVDDQWVIVYNKRGSLRVRVHVTEEIRPGVCALPSIWWNVHMPDGHGVNALTTQEETDMGGGAAYYDAAVWVKPEGGAHGAEMVDTEGGSGTLGRSSGHPEGLGG
ncbi:MAG: molybdopterin oxidoreductase family protein [Chloroflexi bacterium]|nr:molybdopterin oxidoreductase family protein [Chloroflexota bacterium]